MWINKLEDAIASGTPEELEQAFVGDLSTLSDLLRHRQKFTETRDQLDAMLQSDEGHVGTLQTNATNKDEGTVKTTVEALRHILDAAATLAKNKDSDPVAVQESASSLNAAVTCLTELNSDQQPATLAAWEDPPSEGGHVDWLGELFAAKVTGSTFAVLCVYQQLRCLLGLDQDDQARVAATPVLGADEGGGGGLRMMLTVTLYPSAIEGIVPDFRYFGLTELKHADEKECLLKSVQRCWEAARLSGYRAVWRLEHTDISSPSDYFIPPHIYGRSFEAAIVCCLRAAAGNAYAEDDFEGEVAPEPLSPTVAISATLGKFEPGQTNVIDIPLIPVAGIPQKLCEARGSTISQVVFAKDQWTEEAISELDDASQEDRTKAATTAEKPEDQSKLQWSTAGDMGTALDLLLERNRWLRDWQKTTRENWLSRWEKGTARAPGDEAPGPDDDNLPLNPDGSPRQSDSENETSSNDASTDNDE